MEANIELKRRNDLATMGYLVVVGLIFFHTSQIFSPFGLFIKNAAPGFNQASDYIATVFIYFVTLWGMPLMFIIAGMAVWFSLYKRTAVQFIGERVRRLLVPFLVGFIILTPLNQYIILKQQYPLETGTFSQFLGTFLDLEFDLASPIFFNSAHDAFTLLHMWFLIYLFVYSLLLLPIFLYLRQPSGKRLLEKITHFFIQPWAIYLMAAPLAIIQAVLGTPNTVVSATWNLLAYLFFLAYGFLFASDGRFEQTLYQHRKSALALGLAGFLLYLGGYFLLNVILPASVGFNLGPGHILLRFIQGLSGWFWIVAIMGWAGAIVRRKQANRSTAEPGQPPSDKPPLKAQIGAYLQEAQLPFYILHMTPIVIIGYVVVQWQMSALVKYVIIVLSSLVGTILLYDIGVRRTRLTRFLFGVKPPAPLKKAKPISSGLSYQPVDSQALKHKP